MSQYNQHILNILRVDTDKVYFLFFNTPRLPYFESSYAIKNEKNQYNSLVSVCHEATVAAAMVNVAACHHANGWKQ